MKKSDMALIIHDTVLNFPKDIEEPVVEFLNKKRFSNYLDLLTVKKHVDFTPCFVANMKGGHVIYYCKQTVVDFVSGMSLSRTKLFIEAITLHELFHIWNGIKVRDSNDLEFSEALVHEELREMYPKHAEVLKNFAEHRTHTQKGI